MNTLLIIDDSRFARKLITSGIDQRNYRVFQASNGEEGLEKLRENKIDCVLLDITMPVMDGRSFMKQLRKKGITVPVIVITADIQESTRKEMTGLGVKKFMTKPVRKEEVLIAIEEVLTGAR